MDADNTSPAAPLLLFLIVPQRFDFSNGQAGHLVDEFEFSTQSQHPPGVLFAVLFHALFNALLSPELFAILDPASLRAFSRAS